MTIKRTIRYHWLQFLRLQDTPHRIALGIAIGMFVNFSPFFGLHTLMAFTIFMFIRVNKVSTIATIWVNTPLTVPLLLGADYKLGAWLLDNSKPLSQFNFYNLESYLKAGSDIFWSMNTGGLVLGVLGGLICYALSLPLITRYQSRRQKSFIVAR